MAMRPLNLESFDEFCIRQRRRIAGESNTTRVRLRERRQAPRQHPNGTWHLMIRGHRPAQFALDEAPTRSRTDLAATED